VAKVSTGEYAITYNTNFPDASKYLLLINLGPDGIAYKNPETEDEAYSYHASITTKTASGATIRIIRIYHKKIGGDWQTFSVINQDCSFSCFVLNIDTTL
jgi:hypothetical protein